MHATRMLRARLLTYHNIRQPPVVYSHPAHLLRLTTTKRNLGCSARHSMSPSASREDVIADFKDVVNMTADEIENFLETDESNNCGQKEEDGEATGHKSGRRIVELLHKPEDKYDEDDIAHMKKVRSYCSRHLKQGPSKQDVEHSKWRYSLMNWGHDPLKE